jgi:hypothetical protein
VLQTVPAIGLDLHIDLFLGRGRGWRNGGLDEKLEVCGVFERWLCGVLFLHPRVGS